MDDDEEEISHQGYAFPKDKRKFFDAPDKAIKADPGSYYDGIS